MKFKFLVVLALLAFKTNAQKGEKISTIDFVEILNKNHAEAEYYYKNNWKKLRQTALEKGYIHSFEIIETKATEDAPFHIILVTTYANMEKYKPRESHFQELIKASGGLKLLNDKKPNEFRKTVFNKEMAQHWIK
ncbi:hypothetical protein [Maribacter sp. 2210JD10-5]|uniref:hypothetical protein n=1 Tax=Maribacter sp. 2210JD10-5 TaxID=3386272 RepID=UPI0039BD3DCA